MAEECGFNKIVDAHFHLGKCRVFDLEVSERDVLKLLEEYNFSAVILQPFPGAFPQPPTHIHSRIAELSKKYEGRIYGIVCINPHIMDQDEWKREVKKWIRDEKFVGIKIHTIGHAINLMSKDAEMMFETANELEIPVMVHTGLGQPFASPTHVCKHAEKYPDLKIILSHAGFIFSTTEALIVAKHYKNIYLETSWSTAEDISLFIKTLGAERVMFGTDLPMNALVELGKLKALNLESDEKEWFLHKTAEKVFKLKVE
ncbi:MAG: amidohydrolase family protein [Nitrososphaerota archaeon]